MQSKISLKGLFFIVSIIGIAFSSAIILLLTPEVPAESVYTKSALPRTQTPQIQSITAPEKFSAGLPIRLKIPKIKIDAGIEYVGLTASGAMDIPKNPTDVVWFEPGTRPGNDGSAVIAGHFGWKDGKTSVFDNLHKLRNGDKLYLEDDKGATITFVVRESRRYDPKADASDVFDSSDGKAHLNLITCEGIWNKISQSYSKRLVVFTDKVIE